MESITFELCVAPGDILDRTLGVLVRSGRDLILARSFRPDDVITMGQLLLWIDRFALAWAYPGFDEQSHLHDLADECERALVGPF